MDYEDLILYVEIEPTALHREKRSDDFHRLVGFQVPLLLFVYSTLCHEPVTIIRAAP